MSAFSRAGFWIVTLALLGSSHAPRALADPQPECPAASCVPLTLNMNMRYTNLHPSIRGIEVLCFTGMPLGLAGGNFVEIVNREFIGMLPVVIVIETAQLSDPVNRTVNVECVVNLVPKTGPGKRATANLSVPVLPDDSNWQSLDLQSETRWTGTVVIPNKNAR